MAHHHLPASVETCHWGFFDATQRPVLTIAPGDTVEIETVSGNDWNLPGAGFHVPPELLDIHARAERMLPGHIMTGPIAIEGARAGDLLEVRIGEIGLRQDWGYSFIRPLVGTLPDEFPETHQVITALDAASDDGPPALGPRAAAPTLLRLPRRRAAARLGADHLDRAARAWRQHRPEGAGRRHDALFCPSSSTARSSRPATGMGRRATARSASPPSRRRCPAGSSSAFIPAPAAAGRGPRRPRTTSQWASTPISTAAPSRRCAR